MPSLLIPSYKQGFARNAAESANPNLWKGLVGLWAPSLGPTEKLRDWSPGKKNNGTLTNMDPATDWVVSEMGWALDFNGATERVRREQAVVTGYPFTLWALAKVTNDTAGHSAIFVGWSEGTVNYASLALRGDVGGDPVRAFVHQHGGIAAVADTTIGYSANQWHTVAGTFTATEVAAYIDGRGKGTDVTNIPTPALWNRTEIGNLGDITPVLPLVGQVALAVVWDRVLTLSELQHLYRDPHALTRLRSQPNVVPAAAAASPTSHLYGPLVGPLGGAV